MNADTAVTYRLTGRVTFDNLMGLRAEGEEAIAAGDDPAVIELSGLENGNSAAVALLMAWYRAAENNSKAIEFVEPPEELVNIVELSGLADVLPLRVGPRAAAPDLAGQQVQP